VATITVDTDKMQMIGENLFASNVNGKLVIVADTTTEIGLSSSGKMVGIAQTGGFTVLPGNLKGNIYIGRKA
jgi:hypothetical protein